MAGMYGALGGRRAFAAAVEDFYRRVVGDPRLRPYFDATDLKRLKAHQHSFLAMAPRPGPLPRPARPAAASGGSMFEPDPENPGHADHADYAGHAEPVSRPRPAWR